MRVFEREGEKNKIKQVCHCIHEYPDWIWIQIRVLLCSIHASQTTMVELKSVSKCALHLCIMQNMNLLLSLVFSGLVTQEKLWKPIQRACGGFRVMKNCGLGIHGLRRRGQGDKMGKKDNILFLETNKLSENNGYSFVQESKVGLMII